MCIPWVGVCVCVCVCVCMYAFACVRLFVGTAEYGFNLTPYSASLYTYITYVKYLELFLIHNVLRSVFH